MVHQQLMLITDLTTSNSVIKYPRYTNTCAYFLCKLQRQMARFMTCNGTVNLQIYGFSYVMMILTLFLLRWLLGMLARRDVGAWDGRMAGEEAADLLFLPNPRESIRSSFHHSRQNGPLFLPLLSPYPLFITFGQRHQVPPINDYGAASPKNHN